MIKLLIAFLPLVMLTSCAQTQTLTPQVSAGLPSLVSPTQLSVTPTAASPKSSDMHINIECLNIETTLPPDINSNGILLLSDQAVGSDGLYKNHDTYFMDMVTRTKTQVAMPNEFLADFHVSPDRKWIAYMLNSMTGKNPKDSVLHLIIANAQNKIYKVLPWEDYWGSINWLDNQRLVVDTDTCIGYLLHPPLVLGLQAGILMADGFFGVLKVLSLNDRFWGNALFVSG